MAKQITKEMHQPDQIKVLRIQLMDESELGIDTRAPRREIAQLLRSESGVEETANV